MQEMQMERPGYLAIPDMHRSDRFGSAASVAALHVAAVLGLLAAFNPGAVMNEIRIIQASIEAPQEIARKPPPAPKDFVKPTPPVAILPVFSVQDAAPVAPSITTVPVKPPAAPAISAAAPAPVYTPPSDNPLRPIMSTHTTPPYPPIARRLNEQGTTLVELTISPQGRVSECQAVETSSSERLDAAGCEFVTSNWRWQPPTSAGKPVEAKTRLSIKWDLRAAN
jgi:protein TonB